MAKCVINHAKICNHCGSCDDRCELNPEKICDNCFRCLETDMGEYAEIKISDVLLETDVSAFLPSGYTLKFSGQDDTKVISNYHAECPQNIRGRYKRGD